MKPNKTDKIKYCECIGYKEEQNYLCEVMESCGLNHTGFTKEELSK